MGLKYRRPSVKIGGVRIRKNKNGYSISSKTITGGRKTYNTGTGKTTTTHKTGIKGLSYQTVRGGNTTTAVKNNAKNTATQITSKTPDYIIKDHKISVGGNFMSHEDMARQTGIQVILGIIFALLGIFTIPFGIILIGVAIFLFFAAAGNAHYMKYLSENDKE